MKGLPLLYEDGFLGEKKINIILHHIINFMRPIDLRGPIG